MLFVDIFVKFEGELCLWMFFGFDFLCGKQIFKVVMEIQVYIVEGGGEVFGQRVICLIKKRWVKLGYFLFI